MKFTKLLNFIEENKGKYYKEILEVERKQLEEIKRKKPDKE
ncbi:hypothetical protein [Bacillus sp. Bva_UNVM-123]